MANKKLKKKKKKQVSSKPATKAPLKIKSKKSIERKLKRVKTRSKIADPFAKYRDELTSANKALDKLMKSGFESLALDKLRAETRDRDIHFSFPENPSVSDMAKELFRARSFMADPTSTVEGAEEYTHTLENEFRGAFGGQWKKIYGVTYDRSRIDDDIAKIVFSNYRKIEELKQYAIIGEGGYGSENLIVAMYNAEVLGKNSFEYAQNILDKHYLRKQKEYTDIFATTTPDYISGQPEESTQQDQQDYINKRSF